MEVFEDIKKDIKETIGKYMKLGIILEPNFTEKNCTNTSIESNHSITGIFKDYSYYQVFMQLYDARNFICCLEDASFIQLKYEFEKITKKQSYISSAVLSYYPNPMKIEDLSALNKFRNYIRVDFSKADDAHTPICHPKAHIHIGLYNDFRIGVSRIPKFSEFVNMILYLNYKDSWEKVFPKENEYLIKEIKGINKLKNVYTSEVCLTEEESQYLSINM